MWPSLATLELRGLLADLVQDRVAIARGLQHILVALVGKGQTPLNQLDIMLPRILSLPQHHWL